MARIVSGKQNPWLRLLRGNVHTCIQRKYICLHIISHMGIIKISINAEILIFYKGHGFCTYKIKHNVRGE
jgi:hypothetical protein